MMYDQYGDSAPDDYQDLIAKKGKAYLDKNWPKLDYIKSAAIISPVPAAPGKPAATPKAAPAAPPKP
jgi:hypothetical protein